MGGYFTSDSEKWTINYAAFQSGLSTFNPRTRPHRDTFFPDSGTEKRSGPACPPGVQHVALIIPTNRTTKYLRPNGRNHFHIVPKDHYINSEIIL
jgi:hypothetical protein